MNSNPKVLVLSGNHDRWTSSERLQEKDFMTGVEGYVHIFNGDYLHNRGAAEQDVAKYDIVIGNINADAIDHLLVLAANRPPHVKWVTLIEGSLTDYIKPRRAVRDLFDMSDLVTGMNPYGEAYLQALTDTPCKYIGSPYPAESIRAKYLKKERAKEILLSHLVNERWACWIAARGVEKYFPNYEMVGVHTDRMTGSLTELYGDNHKVRYSSVGNQLWWFEYVSTKALCIDMDPRYTWGRAVLDCAALKVPMIGTRSKGVMEKFFPNLIVENEFDVLKVRELASRLLTCKNCYEENANVPIERFEEFIPSVVGQKLLNALG